jgi:hypothetical protein
MAKQSEDQGESKGAGSAAGSQAARILAIVGVQLILALVVVIFTSMYHGKLPALDTDTLAVGLLPVSAAMGLLLACRRLDLALPAVLALTIALRGKTPSFFPDDPALRLAALCGVAAAFGLVTAVVTWLGRISSAFWTAILAAGIWVFAHDLGTPLLPVSGWPWPAALGASLGLLAIGAAVFGAIGLISPPSSPPIIRSGAHGLAGLLGVWLVAGVAIALAAQSEIARPMADKPFEAYPPLLAALAMGGAYILRGRSGAVVAVITTCTAHLVWMFAWSADLGAQPADFLVPAAAPLLAIPLFLITDWLIRRQTSESAPTGLVA